MKTFTNFALRSIPVALSVLLLLSGCKKDELSSSEWGERASAKRNEILALSSNISCSQKENVTIQQISNGCSAQYFTIQQSDVAKYEKLKKEYLEFSDKQYAAWYREGLIVDPCFESIWAAEQPIRLDCAADKVKLITSANIDVAEAKVMINGTQTAIAEYTSALTCTGEVNWRYTPMINYTTMKVQFVPYLSTPDYSVLKDKIALHNRLTFRVVEAEGTGPNFQSEKPVDKIECINGKPVIKYKN